MKALLLSAGFGTRLKPYTKNLPKCLMKINDKPLLDYWIHALFSSGIKEILINTHYLSKKVEKFIISSKFCNKIKIVNEEKLLGTAGTIKANIDFFENKDFLVAHSDNLCLCNFKSFVEAHLNRPINTCITMMTYFSDYPKNCGLVKVNDKNIVIDFKEKIKYPKHNLANAAVYIMNGKVLDFCKNLDSKKSDISIDLIPKFINRIYTWHNDVYNRDIGTPESYNTAKLEIQSKLKLIKNYKWF